jgi:hypothetical protein
MVFKNRVPRKVLVPITMLLGTVTKSVRATTTLQITCMWNKMLSILK